MKPIYINGLGSVSIQPTYQEDFFLEEVSEYSTTVINALNPDYKAIIPPMQLRRMGKSVRMASFAARKAMEDAQVSQVDAVITGTGLGCQKDSEKFLEALLEEEGEALNPTPFIQSTHNMAAAAIALSLGCKSYNMTYVDGSTSFDSALLDAQLYINERENQNILIGGVDENSEKFYSFFDRIGLVKKETVHLKDLLKSKTPGTVFSEGAAFFVVSDQKTEHTYGKITALEKRIRVESSTDFINSFLHKNNLSIQDIDAVLVGDNGDVTDNKNYHQLAESLLKDSLQLSYKNIVGENDTSSAHALWLAAKILKKQQVPQALQLNNKAVPKTINTLLIYHQLHNKNHSLILLSR